MKNTASFRRNAAAVGLVTTAVLSAVSVTLQPEFPSGYVDRLAAIDASGVQGQISAVTFLVAQLPFIAAILGIAHLLGLLGYVLCIVLLSIGIWRSRLAPRWVPLVLWIFLVVEFVGTSLTEYASPVAGVLFVVAFGQLAVVVWRSPLDNWSMNATSPALGDEPVLPLVP